MKYLSVYCPDAIKYEAKRVLLEKCGNKCKNLWLGLTKLNW